jgi:hypothetical protein
MMQRLTAGALGLALALGGAQAPVDRSDRQSASREVQAVIDAAVAAPPEFASDILLSLVDRGLVADASDRRRLLRDAYSFGGNAPERMELEWDVGMGAITLTSGHVFRRGFDRVSLQARAARSMLAIDADAAREMFGLIVLPLEERFACEQPFNWRPSVYYRVFSEVIKAIPDREERARFLRSHIAQMRSSAQVAPLGAILSKLVDEADEEITPAVYAFAGRLSELEQDSRIFTKQFQFWNLIPTLSTLASKSPPGSREYLVQQTRSWIVKASNHGVCAQRTRRILAIDGKVNVIEPVQPAEAFNRQMAPLSAARPIIEQREISKQVPGAASEIAGYSEQFQRFDRMRRLLAEETEEVKESERWKGEMEKFISAVVDWKNPNPDDAELAAHYLEKCQLFTQLLRVQGQTIRPGATPMEIRDALEKGKPAKIMGRERVMAALIDWYTSGTAVRVYNRRRIQWFQGFWYLRTSPDSAEPMHQLLAASTHPVLRVYGMLGSVKANAGQSYY